MKKGMKCFVATLVACLFVFGQLALSQEKEEAHLFVVVTWRAVMPDDGSYAERDSLLQLYVETQKSNEKIISVKHLGHYYGDDSHDYVVITEYASWNDIEKAGKIAKELTEKRWPEKEVRHAFFKQLSKYFEGHSDEIFTEFPKFRK